MKSLPREHHNLRKFLLACLIILAGVLLMLSGIITLDGLTDDIHPADIAVIFGNTVNLDGRPSARLQSRLDRAISLFRQNLFKTIYISGGIGSEGYDESLVIKQYLVDHGIPEGVITTDNQGNNTFRTAQNASRWMAENRFTLVIVISQYFHIPRAKLVFDRCGVENVYSAHATFFELRDLYSIPREVVAWFSDMDKSCK
jgi:uncharacterized SAM-binding protein YcdF (DUF218 family)